MPLFGKKPVVIEAMQWDGSLESLEEICRWANDGNADEPWITYIVVSGQIQDVLIDTLEGHMYVSIDDWIIRGVQGEVYPCKPDIFKASYEDA